LPDNIVTMQFFQKSNAVMCGTDEVIALIHTFAENPEELEIYSLKDGDKIKPFESALTITGPYQSFGYLEGIIDGILSRRTSRSEEHTSELQSRFDLVCRLLLEN